MTTNSHRDQSLEALLRQSGAADPAPSGRGPCLDAETLGAWADGGLTPPELATAEAHVSGCARCQAMAAVLVKAEAASSSLQSHRSWSWRLGWFVPLAAGAAAVGLWFVVPDRNGPAGGSRAVSSPQFETQTATVPEPSSALADRVLPVQPPPAGGADSAARSRAANENAKAESANAVRRDEAVAGAGARPAPEEKSRSGAPASQDVLGRLAAEPPGGPAVLQVPSPDPSIRWRIGAGGSVEYSSTGGATWEPQASGVSVDLTAGSSPAPTVCWLVGPSGTVLRTTDGRRWQRVAFPEAVDLVSVQATDASTASVTAAGGRVFRTSDSGNTWQ